MNLIRMRMADVGTIAQRWCVLRAEPPFDGRLVDFIVPRTGRDVAGRVVVDSIQVGAELIAARVGLLADLHRLPIDHRARFATLIEIRVTGEPDDLERLIVVARCDSAPTLEEMRAAQMRAGRWP